MSAVTACCFQPAGGALFAYVRASAPTLHRVVKPAASGRFSVSSELLSSRGRMSAAPCDHTESCFQIRSASAGLGALRYRSTAFLNLRAMSLSGGTASTRRLNEDDAP